ncbi:MAG: excinuclease ABC subunit UvrA [Syntrophobacteraceae bacterium]
MNEIVIRGARQHNLKNIDLTLPRNQLVVITGVSGSGKSSLAFDTLFAEGQRRYLETLSSSARQLMQKVDAPDVDEILGLCPAIAIQQKGRARNPRATVGTLTEILDLLRLLFARLGTMHCPDCGLPVVAHSIQEMLLAVRETWGEGARLLILAPAGPPVRQSQIGRFLGGLRRDGFARIRFEKKLFELDPLPSLPRRPEYRIEIVIDRIILKHDKLQRLADSLELAARKSGGAVTVAEVNGIEKTFTENLRCLACDRDMPMVSVSLFNFNHPAGMCPDCRGLGRLVHKKLPETPCAACEGTRYNPHARLVTLSGAGIHELSRLSPTELTHWIDSLSLSPAQHLIAARPVAEISSRMAAMTDLGLGYLAIDRAASTLSSGEMQRVRLVQQIGSRLSGILYVLDEPSIGLHPRDHHRLLEILCRLRDEGNSLVVVEHDRETILRADYVVDMGPGAGELGGAVLFTGNPQEITRCADSLTGQYLSGKRRIPAGARRKTLAHGALTVVEATGHNLQSLTVRFPLGCLICVTGVSGSGKTSLALHTLYKALAAHLHGATSVPLPHARIEGMDLVSRALLVDQAPIGRTHRSTPATVAGIFSVIRQLYAQLPESRARGYGPSRFSFNAKGGRCEHCRGEGFLRVEMAFLPDVHVKCPSCLGDRYNPAMETIRFKGASIAQILKMTVSQALGHFENIAAVRKKLEILQEVGLGYLKLGQPAPTLSGGEAQRIRLAAELSQPVYGHAVFVLDEPTTGLHFEDIHRLLQILHRLVDQGNTVILIEHQLDVIHAADHVIDLGPEGGTDGGRLVAQGTPEEVSGVQSSSTGRYLKSLWEDCSKTSIDQDPKDRW